MLKTYISIYLMLLLNYVVAIYLTAGFTYQEEIHVTQVYIRWTAEACIVCAFVHNLFK